MTLRHAAADLQTQEKHEKEIARIESLNQIIQYEAMRELAEVKKAHAVELFRVIEENQRLRDDAKRLQLLAIPALKNVELEPDKTPPPSPQEGVYLGTPWQRVLARELEAQERAAKNKFTRPVPAEGASEPANATQGNNAPSDVPS
jgi:hypothetical protein